MDTYNIRKDQNQWQFVREGDDKALSIFDTKKQALGFGREYLKTHGGHLRIWKGAGDASRVQEERTFETPRAPGKVQGMMAGIAEGARDANQAVRQVVPQMVKYLGNGAYEAGYYAAYGLVYGAVAVRSLIPLPRPLASGMHDGADAALHDYGEAHEGAPTTVG